ncbi:MAG: 30S ribosomal protein S21 [Elusimicrobiota bacterium]
MIQVMVNENLEQALKEFKALCEREGIMYEIKRRRYFRANGKKRRSKKRRALYLNSKIRYFMRRIKV